MGPTVWNYDPSRQLTTDYYYPPVVGTLSWDDFTLAQWNTFDLDDWNWFVLYSGSRIPGSLTIVYDAAGNRLNKTDPVSGEVTTYTYDDDNRLVTAEDSSGVTTYSYDNRGNRTGIEEPNSDVTTLVWDMENRMIQSELPDGEIIEYSYNADGLLMQKTSNLGADVERFVYDLKNRLQETDAAGIVTADFTYLPSEYAEVLSQRRFADSHFLLPDGIKNIRQLVDSSQVITDEYGFTGWGEEILVLGSTENTQCFKGRNLAYRQDTDFAKPQYTLLFRTCDSDTATFTSQDPIQDDHNPYRYVGNNPINRDDSSGLQDPSEGQTSIRRSVPRGENRFVDELISEKEASTQSLYLDTLNAPRPISIGAPSPEQEMYSARWAQLFEEHYCTTRLVSKDLREMSTTIYGL